MTASQTHWAQRGREVFAIEIEALHHVQDNLGEAFHQAVQLLGACAGRVVVTGLGKSGLVGRKLAATFSSTGTPSFFLHAVEGAHGDLGSIRADDVVIAISYSGKSEELNAIIPSLKRIGTPIIAITSGLATPFAAMADVVLDSGIPREACPMNLAPTSSTTATLALGDALAVCLMDMKAFTPNDFKKYHPAGDLGRRLGLAIADMMHTIIPSVTEDAPMQAALAALDAGGLGGVVVTNAEKKVLGILTDGDIRRIVCQGRYVPQAAVAGFMTRNPRSCQPENSAAEVMDMMEEKAITLLPVTGAQGTLVGVVHLHDLLGKGKVKFAG